MTANQPEIPELTEIGFIANAGEICAWIHGSDEICTAFADWYNLVAAALGIEKPYITGSDVMVNMHRMMDYATKRLMELKE